MKFNRPALTVLCAAMLAGCSLAPVYQQPTVSIKANTWKDIPWQTANPADQLPRGEWWKMLQDPVLDDLEGKVDPANPTLAAALARYDEATAYTNQLRSQLAPNVNAGASLERDRESANRPLRGTNLPDNYNANTAALSMNYELDVWGRVRNLVAAGQAQAEASAADLENVRLFLHAQLAENYIRLRDAEAQARLLNAMANAYARTLKIVQDRHDGGIASGLDVAEAETQLKTTRAQAAKVAAERSIYEHAVASLIGVPAMNFSLPDAKLDLQVPEVPLGIPSTLLQRRPDIAAAERRAAAANATIGVARAAFYPDFTLWSAYGYQNSGIIGNDLAGANYSGLGELTSAPNTFWSFGTGAIFNLFDYGLREAQLAQARAELDRSGAEYRAIALAAFQQVEDALSHLKFSHDEEKDRRAAVQSTGRALNIAMSRYREGISSYLEVDIAQTAALSAQRNALDLQTRQLLASVDLIRALGGGWTAPPAPSK